MNKYQYFKSLHHANEGLFLGNVHDVLSAMILEKTGFKALGTTSWGVANTLGYQDGERINVDDYLSIIRNIVNNVTIPVSVDIESGYSQEIKIVLKNILAVADAGAVGINFEDSLKDQNQLQDMYQQGKILSNIRMNLDKNGFKDFFINARTDTYLQQFSDPLAETLKRGLHYAEQGVDGLFVPGLVNEKEIALLAQQIQLPLNVLSLPDLTNFDKLKFLNVKRFSFGNALSDQMIASMEMMAKQIYQAKNTELLYHHAPIEIKFK